MGRRGMVYIGALAATAIVAGCGGGGGTKTPSPFAGTWAGVWSGGGQRGNMFITVGGDGALSGVIENTTFGMSTSVTGSISADGSIEASYRYAGEPTQTAVGTATIGANGHLSGQLDTFLGQMRTGALRFDAARRYRSPRLAHGLLGHWP